MAYAVKEIFYTLQGEGAQAGRAAVFLRFAGCNLWSGLERDRAVGAGSCSRWCDTDFVGTDGTGGGKFIDAIALAGAVDSYWPKFDEASTNEKLENSLSNALSGRDIGGLRRLSKYVVITGGEPLLQLDETLIEALHQKDFEVAIETNGTLLPPPGIDWICVSPKAGSQPALRSGNELKLIYPQTGVDLTELETLEFEHFFLQPMDGANREPNTQAAVKACLTHPRWRLSLQMHKLVGLR